MVTEGRTRSGWVTGSVFGTDAGGQLVAIRAVLRVVKGPDAGASIELEAGTAYVGSHRTCDLALSDPTVSRRHAELSLLAGGVRVRDLDSKNGTSVGGSRVGDVTVPLPFELSVGSTRLEVAAADVPLGDPISDRTSFGPLVGSSPAMRRVFGVLERAAGTDAPILFVGPPGVGKTACCIATHEASPRSGGPFLFLDVTRELDRPTLDEALRAGRGGTLILEQVERWPRPATEALLAALDAAGPDADVRILATAQEDLRTAVEQGRFPRALYFFLAGLRLELPALSERPEDVPRLVRTFAEQLGHPGFEPPPELAQRVGGGLRGNARELRALVEATLARHAPATATDSPPQSLDPHEPVADLPYHEAKAKLLDQFERRYLLELMERHDGVILRAAEDAGLGRNHLARLLKKHGLK